MKFTRLLVFAALAFSSCAYVQTHRNVQESFTYYDGQRLEAPLLLVQYQGIWYIAAHECEQGLRLRYPNVYDSVLGSSASNEPSWHRVEEQGRGAICYWPISAGTASVLMREDGYVSLPILRDEMLKHADARLSHLPKGAVQHAVRAHMDVPHETQEDAVYLIGEKHADDSLPVRALVQTDRVLVDWPLTLMYNCAIPFMAPVIFFRDFLNED